LNVFFYVKTIWLQTVMEINIRFSNHGIMLSQKGYPFIFFF